MDTGTLANFASVVAAFGAAMLYFRIQREDSMRRAGAPVWIPLADWLVIVATLTCLLLVIVPLVLVDPAWRWYIRLPAATCGASAVLLSGYVFAILAHYRIVFGSARVGDRHWAEPLEIRISFATVTVAVVVFARVLTNT